ncbi:MAG: hypothetical protein R2813_03535 [Flavobacteriales bacterium]
MKLLTAKLNGKIEFDPRVEGSEFIVYLQYFMIHFFAPFSSLHIDQKSESQRIKST